MRNGSKVIENSYSLKGLWVFVGIGYFGESL